MCYKNICRIHMKWILNDWMRFDASNMKLGFYIMLVVMEIDLLKICASPSILRYSRRRMDIRSKVEVSFNFCWIILIAYFRHVETLHIWIFTVLPGILECSVKIREERSLLWHSELHRRHANCHIFHLFMRNFLPHLQTTSAVCFYQGLITKYIFVVRYNLAHMYIKKDHNHTFQW